MDVNDAITVGVDTQGVAARVGQRIEELVAHIDAVGGMEVLADLGRDLGRALVRGSGEPDQQHPDEHDRRHRDREQQIALLAL